MQAPLPIDPHVPAIVDAIRRARAAVIVAEPGAGKTTRVPPALLALGRTILLQPRRVAARALAQRIAAERGATLGEEVGWQVRFERRFGPRTRLLVATEGVLTARLVGDPLLSEFGVVVLDEFHERSLHADLALALAREAWRARDDLHLVVMSATLDAEPVSAFLDGAPIVRVPGRTHPLEIRHAPQGQPGAAVREALREGGGHVLVFLPGMAEIRRLEGELGGVDADVRVLHGSQDAAEQSHALAPCAGRKVVLATNVAETSLTVEGVTRVVDTGLQRVLRFDPARGFDALELERVSRDAADQRAGRAGRTSPGVAVRLWDARDALRDHREPEVARVDLCGPALDLLAWGADPLRFGWYEAPPAEALNRAMTTLGRLGAVAGGRLTPIGERMRRLPLPPRLARVLVETGPDPRAAAACALLSERHGLRPDGTATDSDVLLLVDRVRAAPAAARTANELLRLARELGPGAGDGTDLDLRRALFHAFADRLAQRREPRSRRFLLASGHGAMLARESGVHDAGYVVALDLSAGEREALIRVASAVEPAWIEPDAEAVIHERDASGRVRAFVESRFAGLVVRRHERAPDADAAARLVAEGLRAQALPEEVVQVVRRLRFAGVEPDLDAACEHAGLGARSVAEADLRGALLAQAPRDLSRLAPEALPVPSGRSARLEYREDGSVAAEVKLQELFGLAETPRLGPRAEPVLLLLLAPNGRPVQTTRDLRGFWERTYPEVRRELRGRYPKHPWPEDPWTATPTHRARPRPR
ncbi:MAG: ATP-dependent helicase HrpB [Vicinamibacteria bacterium]|nr:ATP-dependent helicase HrpB [Vicinamibacteria bacterium]